MKVVSINQGGSGSGPQSSEPPEFKLPEAIRVALDLQRGRVFDAMALVQVAGAGIAREYDCEKVGSVDFKRALRVVADLLDDLAWRLDPEWLEGDAVTDPLVREEIERLKQDDET